MQEDNIYAINVENINTAIACGFTHIQQVSLDIEYFLRRYGKLSDQLRWCRRQSQVQLFSKITTN
ncbi:MAG: hypothetical protein F6K31_10440 [Symploca sp. SIO2G7]|nr:hypothetical protein [Symploca sp. SIO2G7]